MILADKSHKSILIGQSSHLLTFLSVASFWHHKDAWLERWVKLFSSNKWQQEKKLYYPQEVPG